MKKIVRLIIPKKLLSLFHAVKVYLYDIKRFMKYSNTQYELNTQEKYDGYLSHWYHVVEKGLTMPETRLGFGVAVMHKIIAKVHHYLDLGFSETSGAYISTLMVLNEYEEFHKMHGFQIDEEVEKELSLLRERTGVEESLKQLEFTREEYFSKKDASFEDFCLSRCSVRHFSNQKINKGLFAKCIELANHSPSACNRQPNRVYVVDNREVVSQILSLQNGNRGFGHTVPYLLILTSDVSVWQNYDERSEFAFNSGLFAMTLTYALHANEIGSCMLNWSAKKEKDLELRNILSIPENEEITVIIAAGIPVEKFEVARSPRNSVKEYINFFK